MDEKQRAPRNRTLSVSDAERAKLKKHLLNVSDLGHDFLGRTVLGDYREAIVKLPKQFVDLLILDPPYNLNKNFGTTKFSRMSVAQYTDWLCKIFEDLVPVLKSTSTIYICGDWLSSASIFTAASQFFIVRNRITWEREKGRGASANWKNSSEDIWFCTLGNSFTFNVDSVKLRRKVIAPYRDQNGMPKDWTSSNDGNFRDTHPSNLWTDITIPFWSMPENTDHPTQKSEKLIAKLVLASTNADDVVFDPFLGSGTTSVVSKKLGRKYVGIEIEENFALLAEKRLRNIDAEIQGYSGGVFWERNSLNFMSQQKQKKPRRTDFVKTTALLPFDETAE